MKLIFHAHIQVADKGWNDLQCMKTVIDSLERYQYILIKICYNEFCRL